MSINAFDSKSLDAFHEASQSLKLYRRAELLDSNGEDAIIDQLYVDPLPNEHVFKTLLKAHTTFLIGRKGTGKSTLFQRLQSELRKKGHQTSAYIDIKTVYESSIIDPTLSAKLQEFSSALPEESLEKLLLYREFVHAVIVEIKKEIQKRIDQSLWEQLKETIVGGKKDLFEGLDNLLDEIKQDKFFSVLGIYVQNIKTSNETSNVSKNESGLETTLSSEPKLGLKDISSQEKKRSNENEISYSDVLLRSFDIKQIIAQLKNILEQSKIRNLYILLDDFSELPEDAMQIVVDVLLTPLNNWSDEFVKFKIAAYPGRVYYGQIDKTKVDEIYLDLYKLYGGGDVGRMEENAIDFTTRLIESRVVHFCKFSFAEYLENDQNIWLALFQASMANPRTLGYLLHYMHESHLIRGKKIGTTAIQEASQRYYEEKIESYFTIGKFLHETFQERSSIFSLKELLESIVYRARELRSHDSQVMKKIPGRPPTSHFHIPVEYDPLFSSLELNFFVTKYFEMSDRGGRKVSIFAFNYGLCTKYTIRFGRPTGEREFRLYFVERIFDYSPILLAYLSKNQEIICQKCGYKYSFEHLDALRFYNMKCRECGSGKVIVQNLSKKYEQELRNVNDGLLLPQTELGILQTLHTESSPLRPGFIAAELDCSYQLVGKRARNLNELGLIEKTYNQNLPFYKIEQRAEEAYFSEEQKEELDIPEDEQSKKEDNSPNAGKNF